MKLRHSEEDYPDDNFVPPELRGQDYTPAIDAPEMIPSGELAGVDEAPVAPPHQGPSREEMLRKVFEAQTAHDKQNSDRLAKASKLDRKRQDEEDLSALLYATFARKAPQFHNLGRPFSQEAAAAGNDGPLSRELALQKVLAGYEKKPEKPEDSEMRAAKLKMLLSQSSMYDRANQPKPPGPAKEPADPREREARIKIMEARAKALGTPRPSKPAKGAGGKVLPTGALDTLSNYDTALEALDDMERDFKALNVGNLVDRAGNWVRESDAQTFEASMSPRRQVVGTIIEGGKLVGSDEPKYKEMMLKPGDGPRVVEAKIKSLRKLLSTWKDKRAKAYSEGGYKVPVSKAAAKPITIRQKATGETVTISADELPAWQAEDDWADYEVAE